jgi:hypothetical protein
MLSCKEASVLLSQSQEQPLGWRQRMGLRVHLMLCRGCSNFRLQLDIIRNTIRRYRDDDTPR